jgi:hypothetical protein
MNDRYDPFGFNEVVVRPEKPPLEVKLEDFRAYMKKEGACIFIPSGEIWPSDNVNKRLPPVFVGSMTRASRSTSQPPRGSTGTGRSSK